MLSNFFLLRLVSSGQLPLNRCLLNSPAIPDQKSPAIVNSLNESAEALKHHSKFYEDAGDELIYEFGELATSAKGLVSYQVSSAGKHRQCHTSEKFNDKEP